MKPRLTNLLCAFLPLLILPLAVQAADATAIDPTAAIHPTESIGTPNGDGIPCQSALNDAAIVQTSMATEISGSRFPAWSRDKDASSNNLRAQGGSLVTAEQKAGNVAHLETIGTLGGNLRLLEPWSGKLTEWRTTAGEKLSPPANDIQHHQ
jgi:hypothetical protein